jgi:uncharacterized protein (DUF2141 family)
MIADPMRIARFPSILCGLIFAATAGLIAAPGAIAAESRGGRIQIVMVGLHSNSGRVVCTLFDSPDGFPRDDSAPRTISVPIAARSGTCSFPVSKRGKYAAVVFHDENADGKFNTNWIGLPKEGYGFSNDASISWRPPNFDEAGFEFDGGVERLTVHIRY